MNTTQTTAENALNVEMAAKSAPKFASEAGRGEWTRVDRQLDLPEPIRKLKEGIDLIQSVSPDAASALAQHLFMTPKRRRPKTEHWKQKHPAENFHVEADGVRLQCYAWGNKPFVLLAHGWDSNAASMSQFVDPLLGRGYGVLAFDGPAHGDSEGKLTTIAGFTSATRAVQANVEPFSAVIGHSIGGPAAVMALEDNSDCLPRLVMISAPSRSDAAVSQFSRIFGLNDHADAGLRARLSSVVGRPIEDITFATMSQQCQQLTLFIHDTDDVVFPIEEAHASMQMLPHARLMETSGFGHAKILNDAHVVEAAVSFAAPILSGL